MHTLGRLARSQVSFVSLILSVAVCASCHDQTEIEKEKALASFQPESSLYATVQIERSSGVCPNCSKGSVGILLLSEDADTCASGIREGTSSLKLLLLALDRTSNTYSLQDGNYLIGQRSSGDTSGTTYLTAEGEYVYSEGFDARQTIGTSDTATGSVTIVHSETDTPVVSYSINMPDGIVFKGSKIYNRCLKYETESQSLLNSPPSQPG
jgi:hypothetical protein